MTDQLADGIGLSAFGSKKKPMTITKPEITEARKQELKRQANREAHAWAAEVGNGVHPYGYSVARYAHLLEQEEQRAASMSETDIDAIVQQEYERADAAEESFDGEALKRCLQRILSKGVVSVEHPAIDRDRVVEAFQLLLAANGCWFNGPEIPEEISGRLDIALADARTIVSTVESLCALQGAQAPQQWISVDVKMPHIGQDVLVYSPNTSMTKFSVEHVYRKGQDQPTFHRGWNKGEGHYEVSHWMPLPPAPQHPEQPHTPEQPAQ